jgi:hypothetical protein
VNCKMVSLKRYKKYSNAYILSTLKAVIADPIQAVS